jgi:transcriptional regulator with XRE-family HTH domain
LKNCGNGGCDMYREVARSKVSIGMRILELLKEKGISQYKLADELNVSFQTVNAWVNNKSLPVRYKDKLAKFFDVDVDYIMCKQVERHREFSKFDLNKDNLRNIREFIDIDDSIMKILNIKGYDVIEKDFSTETIMGEAIQDDKDITYEFDNPIVDSYSVYYPNGEVIEVSSEKITDVKNDIVKYITWSFDKLKDNDNNPLD